MLDKIKTLREQTGVSLQECKKALEEAEGDIEKALSILKKASLKTAEKKSERETGAGIIEAYVHLNGKVGVLVDLRSETDFVAKNPEFKELAHNIALQIAALKPKFVSRADIPANVKEDLEEVFKKDVKDMKKPPEIIQKIIEGKMESVYKEEILLEQPFVKQQDITVSDMLKSAIQKFGENIKISRFIRFEI